MKLSEEETRKLVLALIAAGKLPVSSYGRPDEEWAAEVLKEFEAYVRLFLRAQQKPEQTR